MTSHDTHLYMGVELGGTKCICVLGSGPDDVREQVSIATGNDPGSTLSQIDSTIRSWHQRHGAARALGIASFGPVDLEVRSATFGYITSTPKPGWRNTNVAHRLLSVFQQLGLSSLPLGFDTDVNGAALAEGQWGAARALGNHAYITVGTGVGVGLVVNHQTVRGLGHPELGHIRIARMPGDSWPGTCPFHGDCVEGLISGPAIEARTGLRGNAIPEDHPVWQSVAHGLAQLLQVIVMSMAPQRIVIGGGVMNARPALMQRTRQMLVESLNGYLQTNELTSGINEYIVQPKLGGQAGPLGALAVAMAAIIPTATSGAI
jgi:fructokinase